MASDLIVGKFNKYIYTENLHEYALQKITLLFKVRSDILETKTESDSLFS